MKRITSLLLGLVMLFGLASCDKDKADKETVANAKSYIFQLYRKETNLKGDFSRLNQVIIGDETVAVSWSTEYKGQGTDPQLLKKGEVDNEKHTQNFTVTYNLNDNVKDELYAVIASFKVGEVSDSLTFEITVPKFKALTIAEFRKQAGSSSQVLHAYVASVDSYDGCFLVDETGSLYTYKGLKFDGKSLEVGDEVWVDAKYTCYNNLHEFSAVTAVLKVNKKATFKQMPLLVVDVDTLSTANSYDNDTVKVWQDKLIQVSGKLVKDSGKYYIENSTGGRPVIVNNVTSAHTSELEKYLNQTVTFWGYSAGNGKGFQKVGFVGVASGANATDPFTHYGA